MTAPPTAENGDTIRPRSAWPGALLDAIVEVFSMMVGATIVAPETADCPVMAGVTGVIGITGAMNAVLTLRCSDDSATRIAAQMLGASMQEAAAQKSDAIGEICNMVAGDFKLKIGYGCKCELTVPSVIVGGNYRVHSLGKGERLEFPVVYEGESVWLALDIRE